jgi:MFS family permease
VTTGPSVPPAGPGRRSGVAAGGGTRAGAGAAVRLSRDELTLAGYAVLATWAWFLYGFGSLLPLLRAEQDISRTLTGLHSLALSAGALISGSLTVPLVRALRRRGTLRVGLALVSVGVVALCLSRTPLVSLPCMLVIGTGGSMLVNGANPSLSEHHGGARAAALSEGNAVAAGIGLLAPLAVGAGVALGWGWRPAALLVIPMIGLVALLLRRVPAGTQALDAVLERRSGPAGRLPGAFWLFAAALVSCIGIEFVCTAWSADLMRTRVGLSAAAASAAVTAVVAGMAVGRALLGRLALRLSARRLLAGALALTLIGWLVTWTATAAPLAVVGLVVMGLGIAGHYPLGMSLVLAAVPGRADRAASIVSIGIGVSAGAAPFTVGAIADATSTHAAFLVVPVLVVVASTLLLAAIRLTHRPAFS